MQKVLKKKVSSEKLLQNASNNIDDSEYFTPVPEGYKVGRTKYVVVTGSVMSGLGKGIFSASLAKLLQYKGLECAPIKFDGYLNCDAGTLNPYRHGEVFVLDDGMECDMDLGTYERFLEKDLDKDNYLTGGKLFKRILENEREGKYLGKDIQFIPHATGEIKRFMRSLAMKRDADVVLIEIGGTVGDIENSYIIEAMRELAYEEGQDNVCFVSLTYILKPSSLGEQKSKAAQLGLKSLMGLGIHPQIIACRCEEEVTKKVMEKISVYSNVPVSRIFSMHDTDSIYKIPSLIKRRGIDEEILKLFKFKKKIDEKNEKKQLARWKNYVDKFGKTKKKITIGITGKYTGLRDSYASILKSLEHAGTNQGINVDVKWIDATLIENEKMTLKEAFKGIDGVIIPGGFGKRGIEGKILCAKYARENNMPFLGICLGFQMAIVDFARHVCKLEDANTTEVTSSCKHPVIDILPEQKKIEGLGGTMRLGGKEVEIKKGTEAHGLFKNEVVKLRFRHRYECNPKYIETFEKKGMVFSGKAPEVPIMQILELPKHKCFIATQAHPEFTSRPLAPSPFFMKLVKSASE